MKDELLKIINLPHHVSLNHKRMSNYDRSAQFAPFAALTGYEELIKEVARTTTKKLTLSKDKIDDISNKLNIIKENIKNHVIITVIYFKKDSKKSGGQYLSLTGEVKKIDEIKKNIIVDEISIKFNDIYDISGLLFDDNYFDF